MTCLHLPVAHTEDDIALAGALAQLLRSEELYVAWSTDGGAAKPVIDAHLQFAEDPAAATPRVQPRRPGRLERMIAYWRNA